jgi:hypothetical protein
MDRRRAICCDWLTCGHDIWRSSDDFLSDLVLCGVAEGPRDDGIVKHMSSRKIIFAAHHNRSARLDRTPSPEFAP